jgi:hypothetical protein
MNSLWISYARNVSKLPAAHAVPFHPHPRTRRPQLSPTRRTPQACAAEADFVLSRDCGLLY